MAKEDVDRQLSHSEYHDFPTCEQRAPLKPQRHVKAPKDRHAEEAMTIIFADQ